MLIPAEELWILFAGNLILLLKQHFASHVVCEPSAAAKTSNGRKDHRKEIYSGH